MSRISISYFLLFFPYATGLAKLRILDMSQCSIGSWDTVLLFAGLPALHELRLDENPITEVMDTWAKVRLSCTDVESSPLVPFAALKHLSLGSTR